MNSFTRYILTEVRDYYQDFSNKGCILNEYLDKEYMKPLWDNLNMSDKEKIWHNVYNNLEMVYDYLGMDYSEIENSIETDDEEFNKNNKTRITNELIKKHPKLLKRYCNNWSSLYGIDHSSNLAFTDVQLFKNGWVVHFTNNPYSILRDGFNGLSTEYIDRLWRTYDAMYMHTNGKGYAFAYDVNDYEDNPTQYGYGDYGLVFRTSGIKVHNKVDKDSQVIFSVGCANMKECFIIHISKKEDEKANRYYHPLDDNAELSYINTYEIINPITQKIIFKSNDYHKTIQWGIDNIRQYKSLNTFSAQNKKFIDTQRDKAIQEIMPIINYITENATQYVLDRYSDDEYYNQFNTKAIDDRVDVIVKQDNNFDVFDIPKKFGLNIEHDKDGKIWFIGNAYKICYDHKYTRIDSFYERHLWEEKYGEGSANEEGRYALLHIKPNVRD